MVCFAFLLRGLSVLTSCHWTTSAEIEWRGKGGRNIEKRIKKADWINEWNPHQRVNWEEHGEPEPTLPGVQKVSSHPCYILFPLSKLIYFCYLKSFSRRRSHHVLLRLWYLGSDLLADDSARAGRFANGCLFSRRRSRTVCALIFRQKPYVGLHTLTSSLQCNNLR
jgi:hypothetical protein